MKDKKELFEEQNKKELFEEQSTAEKLYDGIITIIIWIILFSIFDYFYHESSNWYSYAGAIIGYSVSIMNKKCKTK